ncbi:MAG: hypothetical protein ABJF23_11260 [Bryobacteraceae bacterium]
MIVARTAQFSLALQHFGLPLLCLLTWDVLVVVAYRILHWEWVASDHIPLALYGSAIGSWWPSATTQLIPAGGRAGLSGGRL